MIEAISSKGRSTERGHSCPLRKRAESREANRSVRAPRRRSRLGFTLAEICTVVGIIGLILAVAYPAFMNRQRKVNERSMLATMASLRTAIDTYRRDTGLLPSALANLWATTAPSNGINRTGSSVALDATRWHGPYIDPNFSRIANDLVSTGTVTYATSTSSTSGYSLVTAATGNDSDGKAFSGY